MSLHHKDSDRPVYLTVIDCIPNSDQALYSRMELPLHLPVETFWKVLAAHAAATIEEMIFMGASIERLKWSVQVSLLTYGELYDEVPN